MTKTCDKGAQAYGPDSWVCTRAAGHEGPCALVYHDLHRHELLPKGINLRGDLFRYAKDMSGYMPLPGNLDNSVQVPTKLLAQLVITSMREACKLPEGPSLSLAALHVLQERERQVNVEGFDGAHDAQHDEGILSQAACCYAMNTFVWVEGEHHSSPPPTEWPWAPEWWKPKNDRRDLVRAAALILAEIEKLDAKTKVRDGN